MKSGFSLFELVIVVGIFTVLALLGTQIVVNSLRGTQKSTSMSDIREDLAFAVERIERELRNAESFDCSSSTSSQMFYDSLGTTHSIFCDASSDNIQIDGNSVTGTLTKVDCNATVFTCTDPPSRFEFDIWASHAGVMGVLGSSLNISSQIPLRSTN